MMQAAAITCADWSTRWESGLLYQARRLKTQLLSLKRITDLALGRPCMCSSDAVANR